MKLKKVVSSYDYVTNPYNLTNFYGQSFLGDVPWAAPGTAPIATGKPHWNAFGRLNTNPVDYAEELFQSRFFYRCDPTASTVLNRMAELSAGKLKNRRDDCTDEEFSYFNALSERITTLFSTCTLEYLISGMAIPDYGTIRIMGNKLDASLSRKRYIVPDRMWVRNPENITLKRTPFGPERRVFLRIPPEEAAFIRNKGEYSDGTKDLDLYETLLKEFPEYVKAINENKTMIPLPHIRPILRKIMPTCDYPQPFLVPALAAMKHKLRIKEMDHSIATKAIEAILHIKAGNDEFPVTDEDTILDDLAAKMKARSANSSDQLLYKLYTDHTVEIKYIYPEMQSLLTPQKYEAVDADIFMAMGFSRVLLIGESVKSNAGAGPQIILGPLSMLQEIRDRLLEWTRGLYRELAEQNGFVHTPMPFFDPLVASDMTTLVGNAALALKSGVISKDTYAALYGTDFDTEQRQIELEVKAVADSKTIDQQVQLGQQGHTPPPNQPQDQANPDGTKTPAPQPQLPSDLLKGG
jgi:hypothetical protein